MIFNASFSQPQQQHGTASQEFDNHMIEGCQQTSEISVRE